LTAQVRLLQVEQLKYMELTNDKTNNQNPQF
jgi:hypothetical protein